VSVESWGRRHKEGEEKKGVERGRKKGKRSRMEGKWRVSGKEKDMIG